MKRRQTGSAHIIIIIILVTAIVGALGFILWQNLTREAGVKTSTTPSKEQTTSQETDKLKTYENGDYSFSYPADGWEVTELSYVTDGQKPTPAVRTSDYAQTGMGLDNGAEVAVNVSTDVGTLEDMKKEVVEFAGGTQNVSVKDTTVSDIAAFSFYSGYEGPRYHTVFVYKGNRYDIVYQYPSEANAATHMSGYETIVSTFKLL